MGNTHKSKQTELIWSSGVVVFFFFFCLFFFFVFCCSTCFRLPLFVMCFFLHWALLCFWVFRVTILKFQATDPRHQLTIVLINYISGIYTYTYPVYIHIHIHTYIYISLSLYGMMPHELVSWFRDYRSIPEVRTPSHWIRPPLRRRDGWWEGGLKGINGDSWALLGMNVFFCGIEL